MDQAKITARTGSWGHLRVWDPCPGIWCPCLPRFRGLEGTPKCHTVGPKSTPCHLLGDPVGAQDLWPVPEICQDYLPIFGTYRLQLEGFVRKRPPDLCPRPITHGSGAPGSAGNKFRGRSDDPESGFERLGSLQDPSIMDLGSAGRPLIF